MEVTYYFYNQFGLIPGKQPWKVCRAYKEINNLTLNKLKRSELRRDFFR